MEKKGSSIIGKVSRTLKRTLSSQVTRAEAGEQCGNLEKFVESTGAFNGIKKYQYVAIYPVTSLCDFITNTKHDTLSKEHGLWMCKTREPGEDDYAGTCDLEIIQQLREKRQTSFISHICREPTIHELCYKSMLIGDYEFGGSPLEACLLVTVYSLIQQLLQLKLSPEEDKIKVDIKMLSELKLKNSHWVRALSMLETLLTGTPSLKFCVLYWLPALDDSKTTKKKSEELLNLLYKYKILHGLRLVFVTWGESRLLKKQKLHQVEIKMDIERYPNPSNWRNVRPE
uniref:Uncharacterized protein n=1 Tax=Talaromyces marneffei PM1 TaxID=1077442 RepID=A0A093XWB6_TALMA